MGTEFDSKPAKISGLQGKDHKGEVEFTSNSFRHIKENILTNLKGKILTNRQLADALGIEGDMTKYSQMLTVLDHLCGSWDYDKFKQEWIFTEGMIGTAVKREYGLKSQLRYVHFLKEDENEHIENGHLSSKLREYGTLPPDRHYFIK